MMRPPRRRARALARPTLVGVVVFLLCVFPVYWMVNTLVPAAATRSARPTPTWLPVRRRPRQLPHGCSTTASSSTR